MDDPLTMAAATLFQTIAGNSCEGRPLVVHSNFDPRADLPSGITLLLGGTHGNEPASYELVLEFTERFLGSTQVTSPVMTWPLLNPDGLLLGTRYNAHGVDLNRNCGGAWSPMGEEPPGPAAWSEPESEALREVILRLRPAKIVTLHWALAELDADGAHSVALRDAMWEALSPQESQPYRRTLSTSPAFSGSLGAWCGYHLTYPDGSLPAIVTLELPTVPEEPRPAELPPDHFSAMLERWRTDSRTYLNLVRPGVMKMLLAACACPA